MKKLTALLASIMFFAGAVSCGKKSDSSSETVTPDGNVQNSSQEKIPIKLFSTTTFHHNIKDPIKSFISQSKKYTLDETMFYIEDDRYCEQALTDMNIEILSGNIPDIIVTQPYNMEKLRKKGYLADLTPLMEGYDGTKPEDLLPNVREGITHDGRIDYISDYFYFFTAAAKSSHFDKDMTNWTYKEAIEAYKNMPEGMSFIAGIVVDEERLWSYMLEMVAVDSIDLKNNTCDFSGPFKETLEFLQGVSVEANTNYGVDGCLIADKALVGGISDNKGLNVFIAQDFYSLEGSDVTFVGYPSIKGDNAAFVEFSNLYGIMETSPRKEDAWAVLNSILDLEYQTKPDHVFGVPVIASAIPEFTSDKHKYNAFSITGYSASSHFDSNEMWEISPEQIQQAIDYAMSIKIPDPIHPEVFNIVKEEYTAVMNGEQSADECIDMLNNRIGLYLSENS